MKPRKPINRRGRRLDRTPTQSRRRPRLRLKVSGIGEIASLRLRRQRGRGSADEDAGSIALQPDPGDVPVAGKTWFLFCHPEPFDKLRINSVRDPWNADLFLAIV